VLFLDLDAAIFTAILEVRTLFIACLLLLNSVAQEIMKHSRFYFSLGLDSNKKTYKN
jgi:hypothetical protein